jgi:urease accessory protein
MNSDQEPRATAARLARLLQFGDSMFPIGAFAFSGGLEAAIQKGVVIDARTLFEFARTATAQAAAGDGIALIHAHRAARAGDLDEVAGIDQRVFARKLSSESRMMSVRMGRKAAELGAQVTGAPLVAAWRDCIESGATPGCHPLSLAVNFAAQDLPARDAFVAHHYGVAVTILSAALRLMRIDHVETQKMLYGLTDCVDDAYTRAASASLNAMAGFAPMTEILAAVHVKAHVRLFMN